MNSKMCTAAVAILVIVTVNGQNGCNDGYYGDQCLDRCDTRCQTCSSHLACDTCPDGKFGTLCGQECPAKCFSCTGISTVECTTCKTGYFAPIDMCKSTCPPNCISCSSYFDCQSCIDGYWGTYCSKPCGDNCKSCNQNGVCYECIIGYWGAVCISKCSVGCINGICDSSDGSCECLDNFEGILCDSCTDGFYGNKCIATCGIGCSGVCDKTDGYCTCKSSSFTGYRCDQCVPNYFGDMCTSSCLRNCYTCSSATECENCNIGFYGSDCSKTCSVGCYLNRCNNEGVCTDGCNIGFYGSDCSKTCSVGCYLNRCNNEGVCTDGCNIGYYGTDCSNTCSVGCTNNYCNHKGVCSSGCKEGYVGNYCCPSGHIDVEGCAQSQCQTNCLECVSPEECTSCTERYYGMTCALQCPPNCKDGNCLKDTGNCNLCIDGKYGDTCFHDCPIDCSNNKCFQNGTCLSCTGQYYGPECEFVCPVTCDGTGCEQVSGHCKGCLVSYFGHQCDRLCNGCATNTMCTQIEGACISGCKEGLSGQLCTQECVSKCKICNQNNVNECIICADGKYGVNGNVLTCDFDCNTNCIKQQCHPNIGACFNGCENNCWGNNCSYGCPMFCEGQMCHQNNGTCSAGCVNGYIGPKCLCQTVCTHCTVDGACILCEQGNYLDEGTCYLCPENCQGGTCGESGHCTEGCKKGFYDNKCESSCDTNCRDGVCSNTNGSCLNGCMEGFFFDGDSCKDANGQTRLEQSPIAWIAGAVGGGIAVLAIVILAVVCFIRNRTGGHKDTAAVDTYDSIAGVTLGAFHGQAVQSRATDGTSSGEGNNYDALNLDRTEGSSVYTAIAIESTSTAGNYVNLQGENNQDDSSYAQPANTDYQNLNV